MNNQIVFLGHEGRWLGKLMTSFPSLKILVIHVCLVVAGADLVIRNVMCTLL